jgi:hypothetical protein
VLHFSIFLYWRNDKSRLEKSASAMFTFDSIPFFGCLTLDFLILFLVYETVYEIKHHLIAFACKRTLSRYFLAVQGGSLAIERTCYELREI